MDIFSVAHGGTTAALFVMCCCQLRFFGCALPMYMYTYMYVYMFMYMYNITGQHTCRP